MGQQRRFVQRFLFVEFYDWHGRRGDGLLKQASGEYGKCLGYAPLNDVAAEVLDQVAVLYDERVSRGVEAKQAGGAPRLGVARPMVMLTLRESYEVAPQNWIEWEVVRWVMQGW